MTGEEEDLYGCSSGSYLHHPDLMSRSKKISCIYLLRLLYVLLRASKYFLEVECHSPCYRALEKDCYHVLPANNNKMKTLKFKTVLRCNAIRGLGTQKATTLPLLIEELAEGYIVAQEIRGTPCLWGRVPYCCIHRIFRSVTVIPKE